MAAENTTSQSDQVEDLDRPAEELSEEEAEGIEGGKKKGHGKRPGGRRCRSEAVPSGG